MTTASLKTQRHLCELFLKAESVILEKNIRLSQILVLWDGGSVRASVGNRDGNETRQSIIFLQIHGHHV